MTKEYQIPRDVLNMAHGTSDNPSRLALTKVNFGKGFTASTDGYQAVIRNNDPDENLPENTSWGFSGKKLKGNADSFPFKVLDNQAVDMSGNAGGNAPLLEPDNYPNVLQLIPEKITPEHHIVTIDVKVLAKLAKSLFGPPVKNKPQVVSLAFPRDIEDPILVAPLNGETKIGIIMPCRDSDERSNSSVIRNFNQVMGGLSK